LKPSLDDRIARATVLAARYPAANDLLTFYRELAMFQKRVYGELQGGHDAAVRTLLKHFPPLLELVRQTGPEPLVEYGRRYLAAPRAQEELLVSHWENPAAETDDVTPNEAARFYARVLLQPYAEYLASRATIHAPATSTTCPFCSARPVAGLLRGEGDGAKRSLLCSLCSTEWSFLRVICPNCGERDKDQLPVYTAPDFEHVRIEACDHCRTYIKSVDLTRDGHAVPVVDELASIALNLWAEDRGYAKLESNLLGL
jgi:FdhE protein